MIEYLFIEGGYVTLELGGTVAFVVFSVKNWYGFLVVNWKYGFSVVVVVVIFVVVVDFVVYAVLFW